MPRYERPKDAAFLGHLWRAAERVEGVPGNLSGPTITIPVSATQRFTSRTLYRRSLGDQDTATKFIGRVLFRFNYRSSSPYNYDSPWGYEAIQYCGHCVPDVMKQNHLHNHLCPANRRLGTRPYHCSHATSPECDQRHSLHGATNQGCVMHSIDPRCLQPPLPNHGHSLVDGTPAKRSIERACLNPGYTKRTWCRTRV